MFNRLFIEKASRTLLRKADAAVGHFFPQKPILDAMAMRPFELHLELTNLCNADCIFCPYHVQERAHETMSDRIFDKAVADYVAEGGGSVVLTPIVGDALIDPQVIDRIRRLRALPAIDRIKMTTNAILVDRYGAENVLTSGITTMSISIAGFEPQMYERVYRSKQYPRVRKNVMALLETNAKLGRPVNIIISLRPDRPLDEVMKHKDFQDVLAFDPPLDFTWSFTTAGGRITREMLPAAMRLRTSPRKSEACVNTYNGPMVLPSGDVIACSCVAAMDAIADLKIGNIVEQPLGDIWRSHQTQALRASFGAPELNRTCAGCDMYRNLDLYRTSEGRARAQINRARARGEIVKRARESGVFVGG
jgi:radical SAM protein with 4Fe4S-binding SPASM domain